MADRVIMPRALDDNGDVVSNATAYFYSTGTLTPLTVYTTSAGDIPHGVTVQADASGVFPPVYTTTPIKLDVRDAENTSLPGFPSDNWYSAIVTGVGADTVTFSPIEGNEATNVADAIGNLTALWRAVTTFGKSLMAATSASNARSVLGLVRLDEDDMVSNSATAVATQQSIKAYVDNLTARRYLHVRDEKASGVAGGSSTAGSFQVRNLNKLMGNTITGASLGTNRFTIPAGTYEVRASAPALEAGPHQARLFNVNESIYQLVGTNEENGHDRIGSSRSWITGYFTIAAPRSYEIHHRVTASQATNGLGGACSFGPEVYTDVILTKLG